jgi:Flp pilus assembly protein TadD
LHGEAESNLRRAIDLAAKSDIWLAAAYVSLSHAVAAQGRTAEAAKLCRGAMKLAPDWAYGWCILGTALVDSDQEELALRAYGRALRCLAKGPQATGGTDDAAWQVRAGLGKIHLARQQFAEAAECLREAASINPSNAELHALLSRAYEGIDQTADATHHFEHAAKVGRLGPDTYVALGDLFTRKAEWALLMGLADNAESRVLLERIERLRRAT